MIKEKMTTEEFIAANKQVNQRLNDIANKCENLGIVAKGTSASQLPNSYGKELPKNNQQLFFTFLFKPNELNLLIEREIDN